jgi:hypothetical protein
MRGPCHATGNTLCSLGCLFWVAGQHGLELCAHLSRDGSGTLRSYWGLGGAMSSMRHSILGDGGAVRRGE